MKNWLSVSALLLFFAACSQLSERVDDHAPYLVEVTPADGQIHENDALVFHFSKPIRFANLSPKNVLFVQGNSQVTSRVSLSPDRKSVTVKATEPLQTDQRYIVEFSKQWTDDVGNKLVTIADESKLRYPIRLIPDTLRVLSVSRVGLQKIAVELSMPVKPFGLESALKVETDGKAIGLKRAYLSADRRQLILELQQALGNAQLTLSGTLQSDSGKSLTAATLLIEDGPEKSKPVGVVPGDSWAEFDVGASDSGLRRLWYGKKDQALDCLGVPCPVIFKTHVRIDGLAVGQRYAYKMRQETGEFATSVIPQVVINEVMAEPEVPKKSGSWVGTYVELLNVGNTPVSLLGWHIDKCVFEPDANESDLKIEAGGYRVLVGKDFDRLLYAGLDESQLIRLKRATLCGQLSKRGVEDMVLHDALGRVISTYRDAVPPVRGRSMERIDPAGADVPGNYCQSRTDLGPTPGHENGVRQRGCS